MIKGTLKILVFAPHSAIWLHAFPEALIVESLAQEGHEIIYITCGKIIGTDKEHAATPKTGLNNWFS